VYTCFGVGARLNFFGACYVSSPNLSCHHNLRAVKQKNVREVWLVSVATFGCLDAYSLRCFWHSSYFFKAHFMELEPRIFSTKALRDFELIEEAKAGSEKAYTELMKRYKKSLYHTILKMVRNVDDAEDLTIEAFAKAFKNLSKFDPKFTFSTWLFRVATNNCIDFIRKKKLNTTSIQAGYNNDDSKSDLEIRDHTLDPQEAFIRTERMELVQEVVTKLPPRYQTLVRLRYFQELSYDEIAKQTDSPLGTVKAQLHRARELLLDLMKDSKNSI